MPLAGNFWDYVIVFGAGVLVSFTPCVYPVMPLTASFIAGANTRGTKLGAFIISLIYVLGLAVAYCSLAVVAALSGKIFGIWQNTPVAHFIVAVILFIFALVLLDVISVPGFNLKFSRQQKPRNIVMVFLFGIVSGIVVSPCTAPVLGTLLLYVASKQNILHGVSLLFVFSYGVGASLILVGTFSGVLAALPKSGVWMVRIKQFCALVLLVAAGYFLAKAGRLF